MLLRTHRPGLAAILVGVFLSCCHVGDRSETKRDTWAAPVRLEGVPNLHKLTESFYRSAQPTREGFRNLEELGVKTVINLRAVHSDKDDAEGTTLQCEWISFKAWHPEDEDVVRFLRIVRKKENGPFLVHCEYGSDRTGMMCAIYRIVEQGWSKAEAINEMVNGGFGFHPVWKNIIEYIDELDVESLKKQLNAPSAQTSRRQPASLLLERPGMSQRGLKTAVS